MRAAEKFDYRKGFKFVRDPLAGGYLRLVNIKRADALKDRLDLGIWPLREDKGDYVLWIGRMTAVKGPHRAIAAARIAAVKLILAGIIQPGHQVFFDKEVAPHINGDRVRFVGEVGGAVKRSLFDLPPAAPWRDRCHRHGHEG